jgi:hypothetical protein
MVGHLKLPVCVLDRLAVLRQCQTVIGGLHRFERPLSIKVRARGYHLGFRDCNRGAKGSYITDEDRLGRHGPAADMMYRQTEVRAVGALP